MSLQIVRLIPTEVGLVPENMTENEVKLAIQSIGITYSKLEIKILSEIKFIDCGKNLEYIRCPYCHREAIKWWANVMNNAEMNGFRNRSIVTPCCQRGVMLEDLDYCLDMGFAKYIIEIVEPSDLITTVDALEIGMSIGCSLKKISARY